MLLSLMPALGAIGLKKANLAAGPAESLPVAFLLPRCAAWWVWSWILADAGLDFLDIEIPASSMKPTSLLLLLPPDPSLLPCYSLHVCLGLLPALPR